MMALSISYAMRENKYRRKGDVKGELQSESWGFSLEGAPGPCSFPRPAAVRRACTGGVDSSPADGADSYHHPSMCCFRSAPADLNAVNWSVRGQLAGAQKPASLPEGSAVCTAAN